MLNNVIKNLKKILKKNFLPIIYLFLRFQLIFTNIKNLIYEST